ncbi:MAG TPA: galactose oxidase [Acidobacteria bacterium]|nr:galactose oxidase [Acidobacteriota bacterium]
MPTRTTLCAAGALLALLAGCAHNAAPPVGTPEAGGSVPAASVPGAVWTRALTRVTWPNRDGHTAAVFRDRLWVLGGWGTGPLNDVWTSPDGIDWQNVGEAPWAARKAHAGVVFEDRLWVLGGGTGGTEQAHDVWSSPDGVTWTQATAAAAWSPRLNHAAAVFDGRIWVLGGWGGGNLNDVWSSPDGATWTRATAAAPWSGRNGHSVVVHAGRLWVLGGWGRPDPAKPEEGNLNDVWSSSDGVHWEQATAHAPWAPRNHQSAAVWDGKIWMTGGWGLNGTREGNLNDVWWSADGITWRPATGQAQWLPRNGHASVAFRDRLWVLGGWSHFIGGTSVNDLWSTGQ